MTGGGREEVDRTVERLGVLLREVVVADPLAVLEAVGRVEALIEREAPAAGVEARGQGATWVEIGDAVGSTRQAAFQRFARYLPRVADADNPC
ncbi:hypothetical protein OIE69_00535 [Actinacidiphila glaucinigra]|uniref:hypothetical protein n=1 Tax=Actinacidiphila glaucinigra TaxID=235986 RepID=UPI002DD7FF77|nr:hypothetical protein [Actinacidiphila glaucinigra]WSD57542.1 hypothetical protein OIE69_00535 [Actinacidiphila glaucinigra]